VYVGLESNSAVHPVDTHAPAARPHRDTARLPSSHTTAPGAARSLSPVTPSIFTDSWYVPPWTTSVSPSSARSTASPIVRSGLASVPAARSLPRIATRLLSAFAARGVEGAFG
jgi:hypothetical protein